MRITRITALLLPGRALVFEPGKRSPIWFLDEGGIRRETAPYRHGMHDDPLAMTFELFDEEHPFPGVRRLMELRAKIYEVVRLLRIALDPDCSERDRTEALEAFLGLLGDREVGSVLADGRNFSATVPGSRAIISRDRLTLEACRLFGQLGATA